MKGKKSQIQTQSYGCRCGEIFETWRKALDGPELCIEIQSATLEEDSYLQVFDLWVWGYGKMIEIWDDFKVLPISQSLDVRGASCIVQKALNVNDHVFHATPNEIGIVEPCSQMLVIHLRRGGYKEACKMLPDYNATYYSWNLFEFLPNKFTPPSGGVRATADRARWSTSDRRSESSRRS